MRTQPRIGIGPLVGIGGGIGLVMATANSADVALGVVFGACVGLLIGLMLDAVMAAPAGGRPEVTVPGDDEGVTAGRPRWRNR